MAALVASIAADLSTLSSEAKKEHVAVKEAAELALVRLRRLKDANLEDGAGEDFVSPFMLACNHINAPKKMLTVAISALQRIVANKIAAPTQTLNIVRVLAIQLGTPHLEVQFKILQTLPFLLNEPYHNVSVDMYHQLFGICFHFLAHKSPDVHNTAEASLRQVLALLLDRVADTPAAHPAPAASAAGGADGDAAPPASTATPPIVHTAATMFIQDLCALCADEQPAWLNKVSISSLLAMDLLDLMLRGHPGVFRDIPPFTAIVRESICPLVVRLLRSHPAFPILLRITRLVSVVFLEMGESLPTECEIFYSIFVRFLDRSGISSTVYDSSNNARTGRLNVAAARIVAGAHRVLAEGSTPLPSSPQAGKLIPHEPGGWDDRGETTPLYAVALVLELLHHVTLQPNAIRAVFARYDGPGNPTQIFGKIVKALHSILEGLVKANAARAAAPGIPISANALDAAFTHFETRPFRRLDLVEECPDVPLAMLAAVALECLVNISDSLPPIARVPLWATTDLGSPTDGPVPKPWSADMPQDILAHVTEVNGEKLARAFFLVLEMSHSDSVVQYLFSAVESLSTTCGDLHLFKLRHELLATLAHVSLPSWLQDDAVRFSSVAKSAVTVRHALVRPLLAFGLHLFSPVLQALRSLFNVALVQGANLTDSWDLVLDVFDRFDWYMQEYGPSARHPSTLVAETPAGPPSPEVDRSAKARMLRALRRGRTRGRGLAVEAADSAADLDEAASAAELFALSSEASRFVQASTTHADEALVALVTALGGLALRTLAVVATADVGALRTPSRGLEVPPEVLATLPPRPTDLEDAEPSSLSAFVTSVAGAAVSQISDGLFGTDAAHAHAANSAYVTPSKTPVVRRRSVSHGSVEDLTLEFLRMDTPTLAVNRAAGEVRMEVDDSGPMVERTGNDVRAPFALVKLVEAAELNIFRLSVVWDLVRSHLEAMSRYRASAVRTFAVTSLATLSILALASPRRRESAGSSSEGIVASAPAPAAPTLTSSASSSYPRVSASAIIQSLWSFWRAPFENTKSDAVQALTRILDEAGETVMRDDEAAETVLKLLVVVVGDGDTSAAWSMPLVATGFRGIKLIVDEFLTSLKVPHYCSLLKCLQEYGAQKQDVNVGLTAVGMMWTAADFGLQSSWAAPDMVRVWMLALSGLSRLATDPRPEIRHCALQTLFSAVVSHHGKLQSNNVQDSLLMELLPLLQRTSEAMRAAAGSKEVVQGVEIGRRGGRAVRGLVHHSRNTVEKQWNETQVLALQGLCQVVCSLLPKYESEPWFDLAWEYVLSLLRAIVFGVSPPDAPRQSEPGGSFFVPAQDWAAAVASDPIVTSKEVAAAAVSMLQELGQVCLDTGSRVTKYKVGMKVVGGALIESEDPAPASGHVHGQDRARKWQGLWSVITQCMTCESLADEAMEEAVVALCDLLRVLVECGQGAVSLLGTSHGAAIIRQVRRLVVTRRETQWAQLIGGDDDGESTSPRPVNVHSLMPPGSSSPAERGILRVLDAVSAVLQELGTQRSDAPAEPVRSSLMDNQPTAIHASWVELLSTAIALGTLSDTDFVPPQATGGVSYVLPPISIAEKTMVTVDKLLNVAPRAAVVAVFNDSAHLLGNALLRSHAVSQVLMHSPELLEHDSSLSNLVGLGLSKLSVHGSQESSSLLDSFPAAVWGISPLTGQVADTARARRLCAQTLRYLQIISKTFGTMVSSVMAHCDNEDAGIVGTVWALLVHTLVRIAQGNDDVVVWRPSDATTVYDDPDPMAAAPDDAAHQAALRMSLGWGIKGPVKATDIDCERHLLLTICTVLKQRPDLVQSSGDVLRSMLQLMNNAVIAAWAHGEDSQDPSGLRGRRRRMFGRACIEHLVALTATAGTGNAQLCDLVLPVVTKSVSEVLQNFGRSEHHAATAHAAAKSEAATAEHSDAKTAESVRASRPQKAAIPHVMVVDLVYVLDLVAESRVAEGSAIFKQLGAFGHVVLLTPILVQLCAIRAGSVSARIHRLLQISSTQLAHDLLPRLGVSVADYISTASTDSSGGDE